MKYDNARHPAFKWSIDQQWIDVEEFPIVTFDFPGHS